jgi:hypothetical protein
MVVADKLDRRLCKGHFYKPQMSKFGEFSPNTFQAVSLSELLKLTFVSAPDEKEVAESFSNLTRISP